MWLKKKGQRVRCSKVEFLSCIPKLKVKVSSMIRHIGIPDVDVTQLIKQGLQTIRLWNANA
jgi:hypothetical protein